MVPMLLHIKIKTLFHSFIQPVGLIDLENPIKKFLEISFETNLNPYIMQDEERLDLQPTDLNIKFSKA